MIFIGLVSKSTLHVRILKVQFSFPIMNAFATKPNLMVLHLHIQKILMLNL